MIAKKHRFHGHNSVSKVRGRPLKVGDFVVYSRSTNRKDYRLAVVVSKKIARFAVDRNRIRRRLFEAARVSGILNGRGLDVVVVVRSASAMKTPWEQLLMLYERVAREHEH